MDRERLGRIIALVIAASGIAVVGIFIWQEIIRP
jgi:ABC-type enterochelin transport system permease subunit